jgi:tRNA (mo5U34)-methyltransferase
LLSWLTKMGFEDPKTIDVSTTTTQEQRSTQWMRFHSLGDFLDPLDPSKSIEGHPAPRRAIVTATVPS